MIRNLDYKAWTAEVCQHTMLWISTRMAQHSSQTWWRATVCGTEGLGCGRVFRHRQTPHYEETNKLSGVAFEDACPVKRKKWVCSGSHTRSTSQSGQLPMCSLPSLSCTLSSLSFSPGTTPPYSVTLMNSGGHLEPALSVLSALNV